jgi:hypothetical protein
MVDFNAFLASMIFLLGLFIFYFLVLVVYFSQLRGARLTLLGWRITGSRFPTWYNIASLCSIAGMYLSFVALIARFGRSSEWTYAAAMSAMLYVALAMYGRHYVREHGLAELADLEEE